MKKLLYIFAIFSIMLINNANALESSKSTDKVKASIITSKDNIYYGESFEVLVKLEMKNGWHTYWQNPGESGEKTKVSFSLPTGYKAIYQEESYPITFVTDNIHQYGYDKVGYQRYIIQNDIKINENIQDLVFFQANISWLACLDECVPEKVSIQFPLAINKQDNIPSNDWHKELEIAKNTFPKKENWLSYYNVIDNKLILNIESNHNLKNIKNIKFIPYISEIIKDNSKQAFEYKDNGHIIIEVPIYEETISQISGIIYIDNYVFEINPIKQENIINIIKHNKNDDTFVMILLMAFVGGLILNLMPCILPIITIKAISLAQNSVNKRESKIEALMYFFGVVLSFLSIASILALLRINGEKIGWGFQLQSPTFIIIMIIIFAIVFLSLLDIIIIKNPFAKVGRVSFEKKRLNSFITGLFSVLIASPCSAPFMGVAVGYTLSKPLYIYYPIFLSLSIGYALPFTLIGFFPETIHKFIPKPGKWMMTLKKILSIPIALTCVWLSWVLYAQVSNDNLQDLNWRGYDETLVNEEIKNGNPVFIDFTAKWCVTCLINKKTTLESKYFNKIVMEKNIKLFRADWTKKDEKITASLEKFQRNSVPLYVYYENGEYTILPQILNKSVIKEYF